VDDDIMKIPLIHLSVSCSQMAFICQRKSTTTLSRKNKANLTDVLSNERLVFTNYRQRISNVKKVPKLVSSSSSLPEDLQALEAKLADIGLVKAVPSEGSSQCESSLGEAFLLLPDQPAGPEEALAAEGSSDAFWRSVLAWTAQLGGTKVCEGKEGVRAERRAPPAPHWNEASVFGSGSVPEQAPPREEEGLLRLLQTVHTLSEENSMLAARYEALLQCRRTEQDYGARRRDMQLLLAREPPLQGESEARRRDPRTPPSRPGGCEEAPLRPPHSVKEGYSRPLSGMASSLGSGRASSGPKTPVAFEGSAYAALLRHKGPQKHHSTATMEMLHRKVAATPTRK